MNLECFPVIRYKLAWHPPPRCKALEASHECLSRHVSHNIKVNCSGDAESKEANPYLVGCSQAKGTYAEWPSKVNTCERKWWFLSESKLGQSRGWWSTACRSLKSLTYHIMIDYRSHQASTFHNPELCPYLSQGLLDSLCLTRLCAS